MNIQIPRDQLDEAQLAEALKTCAQEPIHIPNLIQPHGCLIVVDARNDTILQASHNLPDIIAYNPEDAIGKNLDAIIGPGQVERINASIRQHDLQPVKGAQISLNGQDYHAAVHITGPYKVIEIEKTPQATSEDITFNHGLSDLMRDYAIDIQSATDTEELYNLLVNGVRTISKFDRVKLYRFDEDWNGAVVAEAKADFMPSYLGLNFPASDIPEQARKLYSKNFMRLIADITYKPVALHPDRIGTAPLDMSYSVLRSVSPVHIQYLDNIGVKASMSVSIMQNGKLWGLVACHHNSAHWIPYRIRILSESMGHIFSAKLSSIETAQEQRNIKQKGLLLEKLSLNLNSHIKPNDILSEHSNIAIDALSAQGLAIRTGRTTHTYGTVPPASAVERLLDWCTENMNHDILYTNDAGQYLKSRHADITIHGGILAVPIGQQKNDLAIWFRTEKAAEVAWAGNPEKPVEQTKAGYRLTPRASFELWKTTTKGKSEIWSDGDIAVARSVAQIILENEKIFAERSSLAKTDFLSSMSHELRTPMGAVIGITQILNRDETLNARQKELVSTLNVSAVTLLNLINDLLDISKIEANKIELEDVPFRASELLEDVHRLMHIKAQEKNIAFNVNYPARSDPYFVGDLAKIRQILINLVGNALKFTQAGYVNLTFAPGPVEGDICHVTFEVADSGIGIPADKIDAVFEKFIQADPSITRKYGGTGLGLPISKTIANAMGGTIEVMSREGFGSRFFVKLPLRMQSPEAAPAEKPESTSEPVTTRAGAKKILLVEDQESNIFVTMHFLDERGFAVTVANNGREALAELEKDRYDLVIMDVQMPLMDGLATTKAIRSREQAGEIPYTPIMAMTANALKEDRQKCLDAGMDEYISKPIKLDDFNQKLDTLLKIA